jgi:hypothetical protein
MSDNSELVEAIFAGAPFIHMLGVEVVPVRQGVVRGQIERYARPSATAWLRSRRSVDDPGGSHMRWSGSIRRAGRQRRDHSGEQSVILASRLGASSILPRASVACGENFDIRRSRGSCRSRGEPRNGGQSLQHAGGHSKKCNTK